MRSFDTADYIDVSDYNTVKLIQAAYDLSQPVGMGFMHFTPEPLSEKDAISLIQQDGNVYLDYVKGRCCKFKIFVDGGKKYILKNWYDHTSDQLESLLEMANRE